MRAGLIEDAVHEVPIQIVLAGNPLDNPLMNIRFNFRRRRQGELSGNAWGNVTAKRFEPWETNVRRPELALMLVYSEAEGLHADMAASDGLFDDAAAAAFLSEWTALLESLGRDPDQPICGSR